MLMKLDYTLPISDENVTVMDITFSDIPVRLYLPKRKSASQRPAVIFVHGGAFVLGSCKLAALDLLNRQTAKNLGAVVVGVEYFRCRLLLFSLPVASDPVATPWTAAFQAFLSFTNFCYRLGHQYQFPVAHEDVVSVVKFFLQDKILAKYGVDPARVCISGDSAGGLIAAAVAQLIQNDPEFKNKLKAQALIYPSLQVIDIAIPSQRENEHGLILSKKLGIELACLYLTQDKALPQAMMKNQHMPHGSRHLFKLVDWSIFLPEKYKKNHVYAEPILGRLNPSYSALLDSRLSPLAVNDSQLQNLPLTYILTCQYDLIRDDGLMYVSRLQNVGVKVSHDHMEDGIHGALSFMASPINLQLGIRIKDKYINWLEENL
ncbi:arylacetamide deacetylase-like 2 isoform X2 [Cervus elaphus]|uniref:arylacetamide deacetylase-like 2 isoform X2 n=1 Tax=Cervus elaphus TaxID=9860 RepID=UPI001CC30759|nr:arylacetamide deacetylase-like 2 isoform X2 [Cervus elaphus]XP_043731215.1 arylacetamide deacetylase-like 2 isoform X2 [Cervus elaphus]